MNRCLAVLLICLFQGVALTAATNSASDLSLATVQAAVNAASSGDTILLPPGQATWAGSLTVTAPMTIRGAGTNSTSGTILVNGTGDTATAIIHFAPNSDQLVRVSQIAFDGNNAGQCVSVSYTSPLSWNTKTRIDHCLFKNSNDRALELCSFGVVDHCTFYNCVRKIAGIKGQNPYGEYNWTAYPANGFGSSNYIYFESCTVIQDTGITPGSIATVGAERGARYAVRDCSFLNNSLQSVDGFDFHGNLESSEYRGTIAFEIYSNVFTYGVGSAIGKLADVRGGSGLIYSNVVTGPTAAIQLREEDVYHWGKYPTYYDPVTNVFCWANSNNGALLLPEVLNSTTLDHVENVSSTNVIRLGIEYFTNTPALFSQLVYPHPLVTLLDGPPPITVSTLTVNQLRGQ